MFADARRAPFRPSAPGPRGSRASSACGAQYGHLPACSRHSRAARMVERDLNWWWRCRQDRSEQDRRTHKRYSRAPFVATARGRSPACARRRIIRSNAGIRPWFAHVGPDGSTVESRSQAYGYHNWEILGENLVMGTGSLDPDSIVDAWMRSPAHRRIILSPDLEEIGVGCYLTFGKSSRYWCVQEFGAE